MFYCYSQMSRTNSGISSKKVAKYMSAKHLHHGYSSQRPDRQTNKKVICRVIYLNISSEEFRKLSLLGFKLYPRRIKVGVYTEIASEARCTPSQSPFSSQVFFCLQKQPFSLLKTILC